MTAIPIPAEVYMTELWCQRQTGPGTDQIYVRVEGTQSDTSVPINARLPGGGDDHWDLRDDDEGRRKVGKTLLWAGKLADQQYASFTVTVREGTKNDSTDETPGRIRVIVSNNNGRITVKGTPEFNNTTGGECAPEPNHPGDEVFNLKNDGGHYVMWINAPGSCS